MTVEIIWETDTSKWDPCTQTPYFNWWVNVDADRYSTRDDKLVFWDFGVPRANSGGRVKSEDADARYGVPGFGEEVSLRPRFVNKDHADIQDWRPPKEAFKATPPPPGTVLTVVIDEGISLSHRAFRDENGRSRILAAWQQNAPWEAGRAQAYLHFGSELYAHEIDELITRHTCGDTFDQVAFDRDALLVDMVNFDGQRALAHRAAHGTFVADIAAGGADTQMMVVSLPNRASVGASGTFLEYFAMFGILRMIDLADRLWSMLPDDEKQACEFEGYPMVVNLSYSKLAGGREVATGVANELEEINAARRRNGPHGKVKSKIYFVFPAGNDNLSEGFGQFKVPGHTACTVELDVPPEDQSSSFLEIWVNADVERLDAQTPVAIDLFPPGAAENTEVSEPGKDGAFFDLIADGDPNLEVLARLYSSTFHDDDGIGGMCETHSDPDTGGQVPEGVALLQGSDADALAGGDGPLLLGPPIQRYLLAMRPTLINVRPKRPFQSGRWKVRLTNTSDIEMVIHLAVQSDQSVLPRGATGLRPRLHDPHYQRYDAAGRVIDSYSYDVETGSRRPPVNTDRGTGTGANRYVFRHGTLSALATGFLQMDDISQLNPSPGPGAKTTRAVLVASAYRQTDGLPWPPASTGAEFQRIGGGGRVPIQPNCSYPTESGVTVPGLLAAGSCDGSVVSFSGTSFATAQATREIAEFLSRHAQAESHQTDAIGQIETQNPQSYAYRVSPLKSGKIRKAACLGPRAVARL